MNESDEKDLLFDYLEGNLAPQEMKEFEEKMAADEALRTEVEAQRNLLHVLSSAPRLVAPRSLRHDIRSQLQVKIHAVPRRSWQQRYYWVAQLAALLAVAVIGATVFHLMHGGHANPASAPGTQVAQAERGEVEQPKALEKTRTTAQAPRPKLMLKPTPGILKETPVPEITPSVVVKKVAPPEEEIAVASADHASKATPKPAVTEEAAQTPTEENNAVPEITATPAIARETPPEQQIAMAEPGKIATPPAFSGSASAQQATPEENQANAETAQQPAPLAIPDNVQPAPEQIAAAPEPTEAAQEAPESMAPATPQHNRSAAMPPEGTPETIGPLTMPQAPITVAQAPEQQVGASQTGATESSGGATNAGVAANNETSNGEAGNGAGNASMLSAAPSVSAHHYGAAQPSAQPEQIASVPQNEAEANQATANEESPALSQNNASSGASALNASSGLNAGSAARYGASSYQSRRSHAAPGLTANQEVASAEPGGASQAPAGQALQAPTAPTAGETAPSAGASTPALLGSSARKTTGKKMAASAPARSLHKTKGSPTPASPHSAKTAAAQGLYQVPKGDGSVGMIIRPRSSESDTQALQRAQGDVDSALKKIGGQQRAAKVVTLPDGRKLQEITATIPSTKSQSLLGQLQDNSGYDYRNSLNGRSLGGVLDKNDYDGTSNSHGVAFFEQPTAYGGGNQGNGGGNNGASSGDQNSGPRSSAGSIGAAGQLGGAAGQRVAAPQAKPSQTPRDMTLTFRIISAPRH